jgi:hypothetical protein
MAVWEIRCFHNERGRDLFCEAYAAQTVPARANFRATINGLRHQQGIEGWCRENGFDLLTGKKYRRYRGLGKVRVKTAEPRTDRSVFSGLGQQPSRFLHGQRSETANSPPQTSLKQLFAECRPSTPIRG